MPTIVLRHKMLARMLPMLKFKQHEIGNINQMLSIAVLGIFS